MRLYIDDRKKMQEEQQAVRKKMEKVEEDIKTLKADRDSRKEDISTLGRLLEDLSVMFAKSDAKRTFVSPRVRFPASRARLT